MTTTLIDKFKAFMSELGYWERFCFAYTESQANTPSGVDIDTYLSSVEPSDVFNAAQFTDGDELQILTDLWMIEVGPTKESSSSPVDDRKHLAYSSTASGYKFCTHCYQLKKVHQFSNEKSRIDGYSPYCKDCNNGTEDIKDASKRMSIHTAVYSQNRIFLSKSLTDMLKDKDIKSCKLTHRKGQLFLVFSKSCKSKNLKYYKYAHAYSVSDIEVTDSLCRFFHKSIEDAFYLHLSKNTSKKDDVITIEVLKIFSPEDFKAIRFLPKEDANMVRHKENESAGNPPVSAESQKSWEQMTAQEKISYLNDNFSDPSGIIPKDFKMVDLVCEHALETKDYSSDNLSFFEERVAKTLLTLGWKLQKPVKIIKYEEFKL